MLPGQEDYLLALRTDQKMRSLLSDNAWTIPTGRREIRAQVAQLAEEIRQLDIRRRQQRASELLDALANAKAVYTLLKWRLFRINELPVEILHRVFMHAVASLSIAEVSRTRVIIASVCSYWRSVALNLGKMWSMIPVTTTSSFNLVPLCLQRSSGHRLMLFIDQRDRAWSGSETDHRFSPADMQKLMVFVASFLDRVRSLAIFVDTWAVLLPVKEALERVRAPRRLHRLEIHRTGAAYVNFPPGTVIPQAIRDPCCLFGGARAPALDQVIFDGVHIDFARSSFRNLQTFEMRKMPAEHMPTLANFLPILQGSPYLERLVFDGACPQWANIGSNWRPLYLGRLRELIISNLVPDYGAYVLQLFSAPELRRLTLEKLHGVDYTSLIAKLIGRFPKVTVLVVNGLVTRNTQVLAAWFRTMPGVRYLRVARVPKEFFEALLVRAPVFPDPPPRQKPRYCPVCPALEVCDVLAWIAIDFEAFKRFCIDRREKLWGVLVDSETELNRLNPGDRAWLENVGILRRIPPGAGQELCERYE